MRQLIAPIALVAALAGCSSFNAKVVDPLITDLAKVNATATADLNTAINVAMAATPPDNDGAACAKAALTVNSQVAAVVAAANPTPPAGTTTAPATPTAAAGALTAAELASLFQPGSAQYNMVKQELTSGCAAKAQDVLGAAGVLAAGGVVGALAAGQVLPVLAAAP
jgi:hypothetical protein